MDEHRPVLVEEAVAALGVCPTGFYVDATFGRGGHSASILERLGPGGQLVAIDRDPAAIAAGQRRFANDTRLRLVAGEFDRLDALVQSATTRTDCGGVLFDLGVSSPQLDDPARGFSFLRDGPLDMRMDPNHGEPVSAWLARAPVAEMRHVIATLGEERFAARIAQRIATERERTPLTRTAQLAALVQDCVRTREPGKHPATRTFQALRMFVNDEQGQLERGLARALSLLAIGGRLVVISFHSLEDRCVKHFMRSHASLDPLLARLPLRTEQLPACALRLVGRKQRPGAAELAANPRARSAVLRVAEKLAEVA